MNCGRPAGAARAGDRQEEHRKTPSLGTTSSGRRDPATSASIGAPTGCLIARASPRPGWEAELGTHPCPPSEGPSGTVAAPSLARPASRPRPHPVLGTRAAEAPGSVNPLVSRRSPALRAAALRAAALRAAALRAAALRAAALRAAALRAPALRARVDRPAPRAPPEATLERRMLREGTREKPATPARGRRDARHAAAGGPRRPGGSPG
jgi:hypothetical protein